MSGPMYGVGPAMPFPVLTIEQKRKIEEKQAKKQAAKEAKILKQKQKYDNREDGKTVASLFKRRKKRQSVVFDHSRRKSIDSVDLMNQIEAAGYPLNPNTNPLTQRLEARTEKHPNEGPEEPFVLPPYYRNPKSGSSNSSSPTSRRSSKVEVTESSLTKDALKHPTQVLSGVLSPELRSDPASIKKHAVESTNLKSETQPFCLPSSDNPFNDLKMGAPVDFPGSAEQLQRFKSSIRKFESRSWQQRSSSSTLNEQIDGGQPGALTCNSPIDDRSHGAAEKLAEFAGRALKSEPVGNDINDDNEDNIAYDAAAVNNESLGESDMGLVDTEDAQERRHRDIAYVAGQAGSGYHSQQFHDCQKWLDDYTSGKYDVNNPPPRPPFGRTVEFLEAFLTDTEDERLKSASTFDHLWSKWKTETPSTEIHNALAYFNCEKAVFCFFDGDYERIRMHNGLNMDRIDRKSSLAAHALYGQQVMVVHDTKLDWRFKNNPLVIGGPCIRFIAAAPLLYHHDHTAVGVFYIYSTQPRDDFGPELRRSMANIAFKLLHDLLSQRADLVDPKLEKSTDGSSVEGLGASSLMSSSSQPIDKLIFSREKPSPLNFPKTAATRPFSMATSISSRTRAGSASTNTLFQSSQIIASEIRMPRALTLQSTLSKRLPLAPELDLSDTERPTINGESFQHSIGDLPLPSNIDECDEHSFSNDGSFQPQMDISEDFPGLSSVPDPAVNKHRFSFASSNKQDPWAEEDEVRPVSHAGSLEGANILKDVAVDEIYGMTEEDFYEPEPLDEDEYDHKPAGKVADIENLTGDQASSILPSSLRIIKTPVQTAVAQFSAPTERKRYSDLQTRLSMMSFGAEEATANLSGVRPLSSAIATLEARSGSATPEEKKYDFSDPKRDHYAAWYNEQHHLAKVSLETPAQRKLNISKKLIKDQEDAGFYEECPVVFDTPVTFRKSRPTQDPGNTSVAQIHHVLGMSKDSISKLADYFEPLENLRTDEWDSNNSPAKVVSGTSFAGTVDLSSIDAPAPDGLQLLKIATISNPGVSQDFGQGSRISSIRELAVYKSLVNESPLKFNSGEHPKRSAKSLCNPRDPLLVQACMIMSSVAQKLGFDLIYAVELQSPNSMTSDVGLVQDGLLDREVIFAHGLKKAISVLHPGMHLAALRVGGLYTWGPPNRATKESQDFDHGYMMPIVYRPEERYRTDGIVICAYRNSTGSGPFKSRRSDWIAFYNFVQNELRPVMEVYEARRLSRPTSEPRFLEQTFHDRTGREVKRRSRVADNRPLPSLQELASPRSQPSITSAGSTYAPSSAFCAAFPAGEATELQLDDRELRRHESVPDLNLRSVKQMENDRYLEQQVQASREQRERQRRLRATRAADIERRKRLLAFDAIAHPQPTIDQLEQQRRLHAEDTEHREQLLIYDDASYLQPTVEHPRLFPRSAPGPEKKGLGGFFRSLGNR